MGTSRTAIREVIESGYISRVVLPVYAAPWLFHEWLDGPDSTRLHDHGEMSTCYDADYSRDCEWWETFADVEPFPYISC